MSLISGIDTTLRPTEVLQIPVLQPTFDPNTGVQTAPGTTIYTGNLVAIDANGLAVNASDTAGLRAVGRLETDIVNGTGYRGQNYATVLRNSFSYNNSSTHPLTQANLGSFAMVEDEQTVAATSTHSVKAGIFMGFGADGLPVIDTRPAITG